MKRELIELEAGGKQVEFIPCGQKLQKINRTVERGGWMGPAQIKYKRDPIFLILEVKGTFLTRKLLGDPKGSDANRCSLSIGPLEEGMATHSSIAWRIPMDRVWWAAVHGVTKSRTQLSDFHFH